MMLTNAAFPEENAVLIGYHWLTPDTRHLSMAEKGSSSEKTLYCSLRQSQHEVRKLIAGVSVFITDECIDLCNEIIRDELPAGEGKRENRSDLPTPSRIKGNLDNYVIGQEAAKPMLRGCVQPLQAVASQGKGS